jgi:hypothetical protein
MSGDGGEGMPENRLLVDEEHLPVYYEATQLLTQNQVPHLLGGGLMVSLYGRGRDTKDIDFYIHPRDKNRAMAVLNAAGFYTAETEKAWLLKAEKAGAPVDLIVHSSGVADLDEDALQHARTILLGGYPFRGFGPEDMLLRKIYSWQEGRPDWWDAVSIVAGVGPEMDWPYFLRRVPAHNPGRALSFLLFSHAHFASEQVPWSAIAELGTPYFCEGAPLPRGRE